MRTLIFRSQFVGMMMLIVLAIVMFSCDGQSDKGRSGEWHKGRIGVREGLLNSKVTSIAQDGDGLVWVGTEEGLFQLTGDRCRHYDAGQMGLRGDEVSSVCYDSVSNTLWAATMQSGVTRYDCSAREFCPLTMQDGLLSDMVACVTPAAGGGVWIMHHRNGIQRWCGDTLRTLLTKGLPDVIRSGLDDGKGHLYIGHKDKGVSCVNLNTMRITDSAPVRHIGSDSYIDRNVFTLRIDSLGRLWGGGSMAAPFIDRDGNEWRVLHGRGLEVSYRAQPLFRVSEETKGQGERGILVSCMAQEGDGGILVATTNALLRCDMEGTVLESVPLPEYVDSMGVNIYTLYRDSCGNWLLGTDNHGIIEYAPDKGRFMRHPLSSECAVDVYAFCRDRHGRLLVATDAGLYARDKRGEYHLDKLLTDRLRSPLVHTMDLDANGCMWLGTVGGGVTILSPEGRLVRRLRITDGLRSDNVTHLLCDKHTREVWIATFEGLVHVFDCRHPERFEILDSQQGLAADRVAAVAQDAFGQLWLSTPVGVSAFDSRNHRFINYNFQDGIPEGNYIETCVLRLSDGRVCFGSYAGMAVVRPERGSLSRRVSVESYPFRHPVPWWWSVPMKVVYVMSLLLVIYIIMWRGARHIRVRAEQTERLMQQVTPVASELSALDKEFLDKVTQYIEQNLQDGKLDVESLAREMAMSHSVFYRRVKKLTGCTASEFIRKVKLRRSRQLLEQGGHTVQEVVAMTGFNNIGNFRQHFKREFGILPSEVQSGNL